MRHFRHIIPILVIFSLLTSGCGSPKFSTFVSFMPENSANVTPQTLKLTQKILQERLDTTLSGKSEIRVENNVLRVGLSDEKDLPMVIELATKVGAFIFFDSDSPIAIGELIRPNPMIIMTDEDIDKASSRWEEYTKTWLVDVIFTPEGTTKLANYTQTHIGNYLIVASENKVLSSPQVNLAVTSSEATIFGESDKTTAEILAAQLNSGRLPIQLVVVK
jgi:SecD/SecF fusion protein